MDEVNQDWLRDALHVLVRGDTKELENYFTPDIKAWSPLLDTDGIEELHKAVDERQRSLGDVQVRVREFDRVGDKIFVEWWAAATHVGDLWLGQKFKFEATHKRFSAIGAFIGIVKDGKLAEFRNYFDDAAIVEQVLAGVDEIENW